MHTKTQKHRHALMAPLSLGMLALIFIADARPTFSASIRNEQLPISIGREAVVLASDGAQINTEGEIAELEHGTALVQSNGVSRLRIGSSILTSFHGAYHVSKSDNQLSIVALTSSVHVQQGTRQMLIASGKQWKYSYAPLPSLDAGISLWLQPRSTETASRNFLRNQLVKLSTVNLQIATAHTLSPGTTYNPVAVMPEARRRRQELLAATSIDSVEQILQKQDISALQSALLQPAYVDALQADKGIELSNLLVDAPAVPALQEPLASLLASQDDSLWMLLSIHPDYSRFVWASVPDSLSASQRLLTLFTLPLSDRETRSHSVAVLPEWASMLQGHLLNADDPFEESRQLLAVLLPSVQSLKQNGYPGRAHQFAEKIHAVASEHANALSPELNAQLKILQELPATKVAALPAQPALAVEEVVVEEAEQQEVVVEALPEAEVVARAEKILQGARALFTVDTKVHLSSRPNVAFVQDVIFSTAQRDRVFTFEIDVVSGSVFNIEEDGKTFLYSLWVEDFVKWASS